MVLQTRDAIGLGILGLLIVIGIILTLVFVPREERRCEKNSDCDDLQCCASGVCVTECGDASDSSDASTCSGVVYHTTKERCCCTGSGDCAPQPVDTSCACCMWGGSDGTTMCGNPLSYTRIYDNNCAYDAYRPIESPQACRKASLWKYGSSFPMDASNTVGPKGTAKGPGCYLHGGKTWYNPDQYSTLKCENAGAGCLCYTSSRDLMACDETFCSYREEGSDAANVYSPCAWQVPP